MSPAKSCTGPDSDRDDAVEDLSIPEDINKDTCGECHWWDVESVPSSNSTDSTCTVDDNPGTGRTVDKYVYQPLGRKLERMMFKILHVELKSADIAARIIQCQEELGRTVGGVVVVPIDIFRSYVDKKNVGWMLHGLDTLIRRSR